MDIKNCRKCGKIFAYDGHKTCRSCRKVEEEEFQKVKGYIYENPGTTVQEISKETEVSVQKIMRYLREGRLLLTDDNQNLVLDCERCGKSIKTGKYCDGCVEALEKGFKGISSTKNGKTKKYNKNKMYIADRLKK